MDPIFQPFVPGCSVVEKAAAEVTRPFVRHDNCNRPGRIGHAGAGHCTSDYCY